MYQLPYRSRLAAALGFPWRLPEEKDVPYPMQYRVEFTPKGQPTQVTDRQLGQSIALALVKDLKPGDKVEITRIC